MDTVRYTWPTKHAEQVFAGRPSRLFGVGTASHFSPLPPGQRYRVVASEHSHPAKEFEAVVAAENNVPGEVERKNQTPVETPVRPAELPSEKEEVPAAAAAKRSLAKEAPTKEAPAKRPRSVFSQSGLEKLV